MNWHLVGEVGSLVFYFGLLGFLWWPSSCGTPTWTTTTIRKAARRGEH